MPSTAKWKEMCDGYSRVMPIREFDGTVLRMAKDIFEDYKQRGVIKDGNFEGSTWTLSNEVKNMGLTLVAFDGGAKKAAMSWIGCTYRQYMLCVKAYILLNLGEISIPTLQEFTRLFNRLADMGSEEVIGLTGEYCPHIISLLQLIPGGNVQRDAVIEDMEEKMGRRVWRIQDGGQRQLADFRSYLRFHEVLTKFWSNANERQKLFYFPLYFWWNLTAVLPLRPMEFLLTPRDCLHVHNGEQIITVRRTKLKGGKEKIAYRIAEDYEPHNYAISAQLAEGLRQYIDATETMRKTELNTLFLQEPHFNYYSGKIPWGNRYYSMNALNTCRRYFFNEVVGTLGEEISEIRLGDTRHLAMANLILSGGSPVICRELAGHSNIGISSHYYSNISNLVECLTLERFRKSKSTEAMVNGSTKYFTCRPKDACRVGEGLCISTAFKDGQIDDCLKIVDGNGHIGDCRRCVHYIPDNPGIMIGLNNDKAAKDQVNADCRYLIRMVELVRKGLGYAEDIGAALLRLQHSSDYYGKCLWEKYSKEEAE